MKDIITIDLALMKAESFFYLINSPNRNRNFEFPNNGEVIQLTLQRTQKEKIEILKKVLQILTSAGQDTPFPGYLFENYYITFIYVKNALRSEENEIEAQDRYLLIYEFKEAWKTATRWHTGQKYNGPKKGEQIDYIDHIASVTFEILQATSKEKNMDASLAIKCAILHDIIEDTPLTYMQVKEKFGFEVASGVSALTKNNEIKDKEQKMIDSLERIKLRPLEIWAVKLADRIANLSSPPFFWTNEKKLKYLEEAKLIHEHLKEGNEYLAKRLESKIEEYKKFIHF